MHIISVKTLLSFCRLLTESFPSTAPKFILGTSRWKEIQRLGLRVTKHQPKQSLNKKHRYNWRTKQPHESSFKTVRRPVSFMSSRLSVEFADTVWAPPKDFFFFWLQRIAVTSDVSEANHSASSRILIWQRVCNLRLKCSFSMIFFLISLQLCNNFSEQKLISNLYK